jgi:hypothetical protein
MALTDAVQFLHTHIYSHYIDEIKSKSDAQHHWDEKYSLSHRRIPGHLVEMYDPLTERDVENWRQEKDLVQIFLSKKFKEQLRIIFVQLCSVILNVCFQLHKDEVVT